MTTTTSPKDNMDEDDPFIIRRTWSSDDEETIPVAKKREGKRPSRTRDTSEMADSRESH